MKRKFNSIKLWVFIIQFIISIILIFFGKISGEVYAGMQTFLTGFYFKANYESKKYYSEFIELEKYKQMDYMSDNYINNNRNQKPEY